MFRFNFTIGDLSGDGHSKTERRVYETNLSDIKAVRAAIEKSEAMSPALALDIVCEHYEENYITPGEGHSRRSNPAFTLEDSFKAYQEIGEIPGFDPDWVEPHGFFALFEFHVKRGGGEGTVCQEVEFPELYSKSLGYGVFLG